MEYRPCMFNSRWKSMGGGGGGGGRLEKLRTYLNGPLAVYSIHIIMSSSNSDCFYFVSAGQANKSYSRRHYRT